MTDLPETERAIQLTGADRLELNTTKPIPDPGRRQVLAKVEAVGFVFPISSFSSNFPHTAGNRASRAACAPTRSRKCPITCPGTNRPCPAMRRSFASSKLVPGSIATRSANASSSRPTIDGCPRIIPILLSATISRAGFRNMCCSMNASSLRLTANRCLFPCRRIFSASALALVEPWACVEDAYAESQRHDPENGGQLLVVGEAPVEKAPSKGSPGRSGHSQFTRPATARRVESADFDDIIYFGANPETVEKLSPILAAGGLLVLVQGGGKFGRAVVSKSAASTMAASASSAPSAPTRPRPCGDTGQRRDPPQRQDQYRRRGRTDGDDACHKRPYARGRRRDGLRRRSQRERLAVLCAISPNRSPRRTIDAS